MTTFYIVRHGESVANLEGIVQGSTIDTSLTEKGRQQATETAEIFNDVTIDQLYSSDLKRAVETAEVIANKYDLTLEMTPLLRERNFGAYEGMPIDKLLSMYVNFDSLSEEEKFDFQLDEEKESNREAMLRLVAFLDEATKKHPHQTIVVVTHGGLIRPYLIQNKLGDFNSIGGLDNCGYIKVTADGQSFAIEETKGVRTWDEKRKKF